MRTKAETHFITLAARVTKRGKWLGVSLTILHLFCFIKTCDSCSSLHLLSPGFLWPLVQSSAQQLVCVSARVKFSSWRLHTDTVFDFKIQTLRSADTSALLPIFWRILSGRNFSSLLSFPHFLKCSDKNNMSIFLKLLRLVQALN